MKYQRCQEVQGSQKLHGCHITHVTSETQKRSETCLGARCWRIWESHLLGSSTWKNTQSNRWTNNIRIKEDLNIISIFSMDILGEDGKKKKKVTCPSLNHVVRQEYLATSQSLPSWTTSLSPGFFPLSGGFLACVRRWCSLPHFPHVSRPVGNSTLSSALLPGIVPGPQCLWDAAWKYHQKISHLASKAMEVPWASSLAIWCLNDVLLEGNWHCSGTSITATKRKWEEKDFEDLASCAAFNAQIPNLNCVHTTATRAAFAKSREKSLNVFLIPS